MEDRRTGMGLESSSDGTSYIAFPLELLKEQCPDGVLDTLMPQGDATAVIRPAFLTKVMDFLKNDPRLLFNILVDITALDFLGRKPRFEVVYHLLSLPFNRRLRIKVPVEDGEPVVNSMTPFWGCANWLEREVWDMFGIRFAGHPGLKRILMYEEFEGHPLRKDYPIQKRQPLIGPKI
jgi:NADH-quinone oxidoreductase subunit C